MIIILRSNTNLHKKMIEGISETNILFFDKNPSGRILNRFSNDMSILDNSL